MVNDQRDEQIIFYVFISIYNSLHVSSTSCSSSGETNCINTASGNSHCMLVAEMCAGSKKTLLPTCTHLDYQHRMTVIRGSIDAICLSWWWARCARNMYRVINRNKYIEKNLCITLVIYQESTYVKVFHVVWWNRCIWRSETLTAVNIITMSSAILRSAGTECFYNQNQINWQRSKKFLRNRCYASARL